MLLAAGIIEFIGGGLVAIGLWTSYAAFIASGEMAVAYFIAHAAKGFWPGPSWIITRIWGTQWPRFFRHALGLEKYAERLARN
jgi:uncharacterized membrane protein YphA (DoxX/SURF4 family)